LDRAEKNIEQVDKYPGEKHQQYSVFKQLSEIVLMRMLPQQT